MMTVIAAQPTSIPVQHAEYVVSIPRDHRRPLAAFWLLTGVAALLISGLFVLLILASRTPGLQALFPWQNFFHMAIVAHVDFSVLIWFAAFAALFWSLTSAPRALPLQLTGAALVLLGALCMAAGPFFGGVPLMSNYVPVLVNTAFISGLVLFAAGFILLALHALICAKPLGTPLTGEGVLRFGGQTAALAIVLAGGALIWSYLRTPEYLHGMAYYEVLFWGSGHILQFAWVQLMLVVWLWLAHLGQVQNPLSARINLFLLLLGIVPVFLSVWAYLAFDVAGHQHRNFFVWLMAAGGGLAAGPMGMALLVGLWRTPATTDPGLRAVRAALMFSIYLFGIGGMLGFLVTDSNTIVPAHYHGCIVGVTLAMMAMVLQLLPKLGLGTASTRLALALPWVYGIGQSLHVVGLAFAGGHGVQRKTAGADQGLEGFAQILGMSVMGLGGLVATVGGLLFVWAVWGAWRNRSQAPLSTQVCG